MKIVVLDGYTLNPGDISWESLKKLGQVTIYDRTPINEITERIGDAEIVFTNKTPLSRETFKCLPGLKYIGVLATGYNVVDVTAASEYGITVTNIPGYSTASVAQLTLALLLELCHHVGEHSREVRNGAWTKSPDFCFWKYPLIELQGKTLGIIGYGRIGQAVSKIALSFGMNILVYRHKNIINSENSCISFTSLEELYERSDVISLHCPLTENNKGMINKKSILEMKDGVFILNTARGPLIIEEDLAEALNSGKVAGAAIDVLSREPAEGSNPLLSAKNCIITPHIAWAPKEARLRLMNIAADNLEAFLSGKPVNTVK